MVRRLASVVMLALLLGGCYRYVPSQLSEISPEQDVRLRLGIEESSRLQDFTRDGGRAVEGKILTQGADSLLVRVESMSELKGVRVQTLYQRVNVSRPAVIDVERRELDKGRTYLLTGAGVAVIAALTASRIAGGGSDPSPGGGDPNESRRVPLLGVRFLGLPFRLPSFLLLGR